MLKAIKTEASLTRESNKMTLFDDIFSSNNVQMAGEQVRKNKGSAGCDGLTIDDYPYWAKAHWTGIKRGLYEGIYCPQPVRRVEIPKSNGGIRLLGIPCVNDRVIQYAIAQQFNGFIDPTFSEQSDGFRPMRSAHQAIQAVQAQIKAKRHYAVAID